MVRYEIHPYGDSWRIETAGRQMGRFHSRAAAFECALRLACEVVGSRQAAEVVYIARNGERHSLTLTDCVPREFAARFDIVA